MLLAMQHLKKNPQMLYKFSTCGKLSELFRSLCSNHVTMIRNNANDFLDSPCDLYGLYLALYDDHLCPCGDNGDDGDEIGDVVRFDAHDWTTTLRFPDDDW